MFFRPRQAFVIGLAITAAASVALAIVLGRLWSVIFGPHVGHLAVGVPFGGLAFGALIIALRPSLCPREALLERATLLSGLAGAGGLAVLLASVHVKVPEVFDGAAVPSAVEMYAAALLPFAFVGALVAATFHHARAFAGRVVFGLFAGAGLGVVAALGVLRLGAPRAGLVCLIGFGLASLVFYIAGRSAEPEMVRPSGSRAATFAFASIVLLAGDLGAPWIRLPSIRFAPIDKVETQEQSVLGLVTVDKLASGAQLVRRDGVNGQLMYDGKSTVPVACDELPYALLRDKGPVAVLGSGGGREVRVALKYGQKEIYAVEPDPVIARSLLRDRYKKTGGDIYESPAVTVVLEDPRGFVRRSRTELDNIVLPALDATAAEGSGALSAEPNELYTVEAWHDMLRALEPDGMLTATRREAEAERLVRLAESALESLGVQDPTKHLFGCNGGRQTTLIARRAPLQAADITALRNFCRKSKLTEVFAPDAPNGPIRKALTQRLAAPPADGLGTDLTPPTDDRPFFDFLLPSKAIERAFRDPATRGGQQAVVALGLQAAVAAVIFTLALVFPGVARLSGSRPRRPAARSVLFFATLGGGFALACAALVPDLQVLLGHPIYGFTTALPALLASVAIGGLVAGSRLPRPSDAERSIEALALLVAIATAAARPAVEAVLGAPFLLRFVWVLVFLVPVGLAFGASSARGVRRVSGWSPAVLPWCVSAASAAAFAGIAAASPLAITLGYSAELLVAAVLLLFAAALLPAEAEAVEAS